MANYHATCRTSIFKIGDPKRFLSLMESIPEVEYREVDVCEQDGSIHDMYVYLFVSDFSTPGWPCFAYDPETDEEKEIDFNEEIRLCLAPGETAIFQEVGNEKLRYLAGISVAVNADDPEHLVVNIDDIYNLAEKKWGKCHFIS